MVPRMYRMLIVEDDQRLADHVSKLATNAGFACRRISTVEELDYCIETEGDLSVIILDRLLGGVDSKSRVRKCKNLRPKTPILMLSAINTPIERAELLNEGADDYLGKPFVSQELLARIHSLVRRYQVKTSDYRQVGDLVLDIPRRFLLCGERQDALPAKEFLLFKTLSDRPGRVVSKSELLDSIWQGALDVESNVVESTTANLRKRLLSMSSKVQVKNARNSGYWIES